MRTVESMPMVCTSPWQRWQTIPAVA